MNARWLIAMGAIALATAAACGSSESSSPTVVPQGTGGTIGTGGTGTGGAATGGSAGTPGTGGTSQPVRTIEERNPFGNVDAQPSYVLDGDMEFSPSSSIVPAWWGIKGQDVVIPTFETGGRCHSGVFCTRVPAGLTLANFAVTLPVGETVEASMYVKPDSGECDAVTVALSVYTGLIDEGIALMPETPKPGANGWCRLSGELVVPKLAQRITFYVDQSKGVVVDNAAIVKVNGGSRRLAKPLPVDAVERAKQLEVFRRRRPVKRPKPE